MPEMTTIGVRQTRQGALVGSRHCRGKLNGPTITTYSYGWRYQKEDSQ